jgi:translation initiation factor 1A
MGKKKKEQAVLQKQQDEIRRIKLPRAPETFGVVEQRLGGSRMSIRCLDGHKRICRIPGRLKRQLWVREGDIVIVQPWEYDGDKKGDIIFKYRYSQVDWLKRQGKLKELEDMEEF